MDAACTGNFPPGVGNWTGLTAIHLTLLPLMLPQGSLEYIYPHVYDPSKKIQPSIHGSSPALFWAFAFIRAPLPSQIARTVGTSSSRNILLSSCS